MEQWAAAADAEQRADGCQLCCLNIFPLSPYCWLTLSWGKLRPDFGRGRSLLPSMESWPSAGSRCPEHLLLARRGAGLTRGCRNTRSRAAAACAQPGTPSPGHPQPWAPTALGTQCPGYPMPWAPPAPGIAFPVHMPLSTHCTHVHLHTHAHTCAPPRWPCTHCCRAGSVSGCTNCSTSKQEQLEPWISANKAFFFLKPWVAASACISSCYFLMTCSTMCRLGPG